MFNQPNRPPVQTAAAVLDFMRMHNPVLAITWCTQNPSDYQSLPRSKCELLIMLAQEHQMPHEAWLLSCLLGPVPERLEDIAETPEFKARFHPMRHALQSLKNCQAMLGLIDEQLLIAQELLGDIVGGHNDPGISDDDEDRLELMHIQLHEFNTGLADLADYYRALAGMV